MGDDRLWGTWRRVFGLSWPVMAEQTFRTLMRTTDVIVTGLFSPAAVAAVGLADLYARIPLFFGLGLGGGAIALSSQDTGRGAAATRDESVSQALLLAVFVGLPFVVFGVTLSREAIAILGATPEVARMGGLYLAIILVTSPARVVGLVAARSLQGTGDTRTPMYINVAGNLLNVFLSVVLGLGLLGSPRLEIVGVGIATATANVLIAAAMLGAVLSDHTDIGLARPHDPTIAKQLVAISVPKVGGGLTIVVAQFFFNSLLLTFGTTVNAAYQIGLRAYQQLSGPLTRAAEVAASILVGQALGDGDPAEARRNGWGVTSLAVVSVGLLSALLLVAAEPIARLFTDDPETVGHAAAFVRAFGVSGPFGAALMALSGALQGGSDTRTPFLSRLSGRFVFYVGFSYVAGVILGYGPIAAQVGLVLGYVWSAGVVVAGFRYGDWAEKAATMMEARAVEVD